MDKANLNTIDGTVWAKEFMRLFGERRHEIDEALMIGWFCNSIMRGFDEATRREQEQLDRAKAALEDIALRAVRIREEKAVVGIEAFYIEQIAKQVLKEMA